MATGVQNIPVKSGVIYIKPHGGVTFPDGDGINNNDHFLAME